MGVFSARDGALVVQSQVWGRPSQTWPTFRPHAHAATTNCLTAAQLFLFFCLFFNSTV